MLTIALFVLTALALVAAQASGLAVPVALTLSVAWGIRMYWQHDWLTREGMAEMATPCVLGQGLAFAVMVAMLVELADPVGGEALDGHGGLLKERGPEGPRGVSLPWPWARGG